MKKSFRITALVLSLVFILGLFSACGATEPEETTVTTTATTEHVCTTAQTTAQTTAESSTEAQTSAETPLLSPDTKTYTEEELNAIVEQELKNKIEGAICDNYVLPGDDFPEGLPMPHATQIYVGDYVKADAYCTFGENDKEIFVIYNAFVIGPSNIAEICYHNGEYFDNWDRIVYTAGEEAVDIFAIDRKHFIVLWDVFKNGYNISVFEDGISPSAKYTYAPMYHGDTGDLSILFPEEEFEGAGEGLMDDGYVFFQSVTAFYFEEIDDGSCRIVLEYEKDGESHRRTAIYDINGIRPE